MRAARSFTTSILLSVVFAWPASALLMLSVEPSSPAAGDSVTLSISGFDSCPTFRDAELASGVASVFYRPVGCLAPPGPFTERIPLGALPAGDYLVQVLFLDGTKVDRLEFRVNRAVGSPACVPDAVTLCLRGGRFKVQATLDSPGLGSFSGENAVARPMSFESGMLYFFSSGNAELFVKVLDGCGLNGHHWLFVAGLTNLGATLRVTDTKTGEQKVIQNLAGTSFASLQDTAAFGSCPE